MSTTYAIATRFLAKMGIDNNGLTSINAADPVDPQDLSTKKYSDTTLASAVANLTSMITTATSSDNAALTAEVNRATAAETTNAAATAAEVTRALAAETALGTSLTNTINSLATVAKSGSYTDLINKPTNVSTFTNDAAYQNSAQVNAAIQAIVGAAPSALATLAAIDAQMTNDESAVSALVNTVSLETTNRIAGDAATLTSAKNYTDLATATIATSTALTTETNARIAADGALSTSIATEATNRTNADALLVPKTTTVNGHALSANITIAASDVGLGNVNNTSDVNKPVSTAQAAADAVVQASVTTETTRATTAEGALVPKTTTINGYTLSANITVSASDVGLGNVSNTSDAAKSIGGNAATVTTNANLIGVVTSVGNTTAIAVGAITNTMLANTAVATLSGSNTGDETLATIKTKLGVTTLSGSNTGDQTITLTGAVTGSGTGSFATTLTNTSVTSQVLTGYASSTGTISATDTILTAIQKLNGNVSSAVAGGVSSLSVATSNGLAGTSSGGNTPVITLSTTVVGLAKGNGTTLSAAVQSDVTALLGAGSITNTMLANTAVAILTGTNSGDESLASIKTKLGVTTLSGSNTGDQTTITGNAGTATKLAVAVSINGVAFDGSTAITINAVDSTARVASSLLAAPSGVATLDATGKLLTTQIPAALVGAIQYQGTWDASTNSPALVSSIGTKGQYYKVSTPGTTSIDGNATWTAGDLVIFDGVVWEQVQGGTSDVVSVVGNVGVVTATQIATALSGQAMNIVGSATTASTVTTAAQPNITSVGILTGLTVIADIAGSVTGSSASCTGNSVNITGTLAVAQGGTGATANTGTGNNVLATSPTLVTPLLGTPTSGVLTNCTGLPYTGLTGTVPTWNQNTTGTAATVTTNANLTGDVTSVGNATTLATVIQGSIGTSLVKVALDTKGRVTSNVAVAQADITGLLGASSITNVMLANTAVANLTGTNSGDNAPNTTYASDYRAINFVAGTNYVAPTGSGAGLTSLTAGNLLGTIPSTVLANSTYYIGTTAIALNRLSGAIALTGITSIDGNAATVTNGVYTTTINGYVIAAPLTGYASATGTVAATDSIVTAIGKLNGNISASQGTTFNNQVGTTYTTVLTDAAQPGVVSNTVTFNNAATQTCTIPPNSTVAYAIGATMQVLQLGAGKVTFAPGAGVTINSAGGLKSIGSQFAAVTLMQTSLNVWLLVGALIA